MQYIHVIFKKKKSNVSQSHSGNGIQVIIKQADFIGGVT